MSQPGIPLERPPMFRRRRFQTTHRQPGLLRSLSRPLALALALVGGPVALTVWMLTSPQFALGAIEIKSGSRVERAWVEANLAPLKGRHVLLLSLPEVEHLLEGHHWVHGVQVSKKLPNALVVQILERIPAAVMRHGGELQYVDEEGRLIDRLEAAELPGSMLLVDGEPTRTAAIAALVAAVAELGARDSELFHTVLGAELLTGPDVKLYLAGVPFAVLVRVDRLDPAVADFERLLPKILNRYEELAAIDLRFSRQIVMQFPEA